MSVTLWKSVGAALSLVIAVGIANLFGASSTTDAYFFARRLLTNVAAVLERAFHLLQVPPLVRLAGQDGIEALRVALRRRSFIIMIIATACVIIAFVFARDILTFLAPGFDEEQISLSVLYFRLLAIVLPINAVTALSGAALNALRVFATPVIARLLPRVFVALALIAVPWGFGMSLVAASVVAGTMAMGLVFAFALRRVWRLRTTVDPDAMSEPGTAKQDDFSKWRVLAMLAAQAHVLAASWTDIAFASMAGTGAVATLEFAQRLVALAPGLVTSSVVTVYYTEFAVALERGDSQRFRTLVQQAMRMTLFMVLPIATAIFILSEPLVNALLSHGAFSDAATEQTAMIIAILAPLLPVTAMMGCVVSGIFAARGLSHFRIVVLSATIAILIRAGINSAFVADYGVVVIPAASLISSVTLFVIIYACLSLHTGALIRMSEFAPFLGIATAAAGAGLAIWTVREMATDLITDRAGQLAMIAGATFAGAVVYLLLASLFRLPEITVVITQIKKGRLGRKIRKSS